ncbi:nitrate reductase [uncultured Thiothrix sp.]|uniref:nitrate reductase n=1 Tax=uncultured Thiothrix sp. TaxID=223185 RepID=UPI00262FB0D1|nr:nitrate reductase [uncultured Thiothrix sp.]
MRSTRTTCPYCGVGCGVIIEQHAGVISVKGDPEHPANFGKLCSKGTALADTLVHPDRLLYPEINGQRVSWDMATQTVADQFQAIIREHGADAVAFYVSGQLLTEDYYVANKLMKGFIGSANIDTNSRLCMSSAVAAHKRAFGEDLVPCNYEDLDAAELIVLVGSNTAWCHPVLYQRIVKAKQTNLKLKVVTIDPRRTQTADIADLHLGLAPGSDAVLFNGLFVHLVQQGCVDESFVAQATEGLESALAAAITSSPNPHAIAEQCRLSELEVEQFFEWYAQTEKVVTVFSQGINQSSSGVDKGNAIINCHLITGRMGRAGMGPFSFTGQPNAMGGREVGGLANQLAAHMEIEKPLHRERVQRFWQSPKIPSKAGLKAVDLFQAIEAGKVKAVWIMATNPVVSLPDTEQVKRALAQCELVVVSDCVRHTDTTAFAHVLLPALTWGERNGTVTNSERRISRQHPFLPAPAEAKQDWQILCGVAQKMGFANSFNHQHPHEIFREHAALSAFENDGERCFDLSAWENLSLQDYDQLQPTQWPVTNDQPQGTPCLFADQQFFTKSGKAQFLAITPRPPQSERIKDYPFVFNTGRVRDHWHTLTRTGMSARLSAHMSEPYVEIHPCDARDQGLTEGGLACVTNQFGELILRVKTSKGQQRGSLFVPMHWNERFANKANVGQLIPAATDPISGQPESKHACVAIRPYAAKWQGFLLTRNPTQPPLIRGGFPIPSLDKGRVRVGFWTCSKIDQAWCYELASIQPLEAWSAFAQNLLTSTGEFADYADVNRHTYRAASFERGQLQSCLFISANSRQLPARDWLMSLFAKSSLTALERAGVLAGKSLNADEDKGRTVCACFNVGEKTIRKAISEQGLKTVEEIGQCLQAGTNCGSCIPELRSFL